MKDRKRSKQISSKEQSARFIEAAKKAEADESGTKFEKSFSKIARFKPSALRSRPSGKRASS